MQKNDAKVNNNKSQQSSSSTYAGKAEKGDLSGRVGDARVPNHGSASGAAVEHEQSRDEEGRKAIQGCLNFEGPHTVPTDIASHTAECLTHR